MPYKNLALTDLSSQSHHKEAMNIIFMEMSSVKLAYDTHLFRFLHPIYSSLFCFQKYDVVEPNRHTNEYREKLTKKGLMSAE